MPITSEGARRFCSNCAIIAMDGHGVTNHTDWGPMPVDASLSGGFNLVIFPNLVVLRSQIRTIRPIAVDRTEIYTNVVRMAMTPFFHGCLAGIFGYFIALATLDPARRWPLLVAGLAISASLHGIFDTLVPRAPM